MGKNELLRNIPAVEKLLQEESVSSMVDEGTIPRSVALRAIREVLGELRESVLAGETPDTSADGIVSAVVERSRRLDASSFKRVINATGVVLHTNLGRAPLTAAAVEAMKNASGYCNLEYDLERGTRGYRHDLVRGILLEITGAEDAIVVNNNAAAVLLVLGALAKGREVIVSRGELVEIGGAFRVPEVMVQGGALLREVGTTNKTHLRDYEAAINPETAMLMKVHTSNYRVLGFTQEATTAELVGLGLKNNLFVVEDLGSGLCHDLGYFEGGREPMVAERVSTGADLVTFSGDKLLGGPQAGIIVGKKRAVELCRRHPLMRALRPDKVTLSALEATLRLYRDPERARREVPVVMMLTKDAESIKADAEMLAGLIREVLPASFAVEVVPESSEAGGGSLPLAKFPTWCARVTSTNGGLSKVERWLRAQEVPVVARLKEDSLLFDPRTLMPEDYPLVAKALAAACLEAGG
ncbi:MAG: L-seryl-tRNA(Sec) selenium transferase [Deltaproteobacteria bacterium]|nr:MAG: L-seryl-tRNA(Sec) selenium transferase [Deltaproteobacteria bacterium]